MRAKRRVTIGINFAESQETLEFAPYLLDVQPQYISRVSFIR